LTYPLFVALVWLLVRQARAPTLSVLLAVPLLVIWANLHGSVVLGAGLVALLGVAEAVGFARGGRSRGVLVRIAGLLIVPWLSILASPYAADLPGYYRTVLWNPAFKDIVTEWQRPTLGHDWPFFALAIIGGVLIGLTRRRFTLFEKLAFLALVFAGLSAARNAVWVMFAVVILVPRALDGLWQPAAAPRRPAVNVVLAAALAAGALGVVAAAAAKPASDYEQDFPPPAARAARAAADSGGDIFASPRYANWLLWRDPTLAGRVAYDARFELLTNDELRMLGAFFSRSTPDWRSATACCEVLVLGTDEPVTRILRREWRVVYRDDEATVLVRPGSP
jgi:hypothetical protein